MDLQSNILHFPSDLRDRAGYPAICFQHRDKSNQITQHIYFPMPPGLEISDAMQYDSNFDLGQLGMIAKDLIATVSAGGDMKKVFKNAGQDVVSRFKQMNAAAAASIAAREIPPLPGGARADDIIDFSTKQMVARNTHTRFQGANTRTFSFKFKMVAESENESKAIQNIVKSFRAKAYPGGDTFIQEYPGTWSISFLNGQDQQNKWIPKIYGCYLTSFSSAYNSGTNIWHEDGSPVEVDVGMSFTETRALNRNDIHVLDGDPEETPEYKAKPKG